MANEAGAKAYVRSLSLSLHEELKSHGIHVTVLPARVDRDIPGRVNRIMNAVIPAAMARRLMGATAVEAASGR
jgi:short-subunit dehydrogenase